MTLEYIGTLAIEYRMRQREFSVAIKRADETLFNARPYSYEPARVALKAAMEKFEKAADAFIDDSPRIQENEQSEPYCDYCHSKHFGYQDHKGA